MSEQLRIVVAGGAGAMPFAGVGWQVAQYVEGFRRLGHDVFYLEDTQRWPYDPEAETICDDAGGAVAYVAALMRRCQLPERWAYVDVAENEQVRGTSRGELDRVLAQADVLVNISGVTLLREEHLRIPVRIYLETDPVLPQIEVAQGRQFTIDLMAAHTHHFTYGLNFGAEDCTVPLGSFHYQPTVPPVVLDWWAEAAAGLPRSRTFTTVANWKQTEKDIEWQGRRLTWSKDVQFRKVLDLPPRVAVPLELALALDDEEILASLRAAGWSVRSAGPLSKDMDAYREYLLSSAGEFSVAKEQYAALRSGWFSDRTASYLACGRPAIVQSTGFEATIPTGQGLFAFDDADEAVAAFETLLSDYPHHARAARELAEEHLRVETVLQQMLVDAFAAETAAPPAEQPGR